MPLLRIRITTLQALINSSFQRLSWLHSATTFLRGSTHSEGNDGKRRIGQSNSLIMQKVFSSIEMPETVLIRDALLHEGISASIQNVNSGFSAIPAFRAPAEVWVEDDRDLEKAKQIVRQAISRLDTVARDQPWRCDKCGEQNPESFETCWSCASVRSSTVDR